ncbi:MAG: acetyl-CoA C-acyltransferase [Cytophagaceae bacterium]|nr:acetyl-CoA C-acyltransferase [Cytophagaceae bacterium]
MKSYVYIVAAKRTPMGSFAGSLSSLSATQLGATAIKAALAQSGLQGTDIGEVIMGNVLSAGLGQAPARQAAMFAGLPPQVEATTVNKVCASGTKAIMMAVQSILLGQYDAAIAGGMESMSNVPYYLDKARNGYRLGHGQLIDGLIKDGLWDVYNDFHMGNAAENTARELKITREMQDAFAIQSYQKSQEAWKNKYFDSEICPVEIPVKGKESSWVHMDEEYTKVSFDKIPSLKPVFEKDGTITAANASTLNDGAAALVLVSEKLLKEKNLKPLARIVAWADAAQDPKWFTTAPSLAIPKALEAAGMKLSQIDSFEINEAFSVVSIANAMKLGLDADNVNRWGGAVSLGHPLGASGARIVVTLLHVLQSTKGKFGCTGICNGGGGASSLIVEAM